MSILVLGTGELGLAVLRSLATHPKRNNTPITVMKRPSTSTSSPSLPQDLASQNITILPLDITKATLPELVESFKPHHTLISCNGMTLPAEIQPKIFHAALEAGIKRLIPWQFGVDYDIIGPASSQDLFTTQLEVRALLRSAQSRMDWVIVSTGMFTSFLFEPGFGLVDAERKLVTAIGAWENRITVTAPRDIGRVVAELIFVWPRTSGVVFTAGDTVSMKRLGDVVEKKMGWTVERRLKTVEDLKAELKADPQDGMKKYRVVFAEGVGVAWDQDKTFNHETGMRLQNVDEWAEDNL